MLDKIASAIGKFCYRFRYIVVAVGILLFAFVCWFQTKAEISYTNTSSYTKVVDVFPEDTLVIVYGNDDESAIQTVASGLLQDEHVVSVQGYYNTLGVEMTTAYMAATAGMDESFVNILYYMYDVYVNGEQMEGLDLKTFIGFLSSDAFMNNETFSSMLDDDTKQKLQGYASYLGSITDDTKYSAAELAQQLGMEESTVTLLFIVDYSQTTDMSAKTLSLYDFFMFVNDYVIDNAAFSSFIDSTTAATFAAYKETLTSGKAQLVGEDYSRIIVTINYVMESDEIYGFYDNLTATLDDTLSGEYYLVGESAMSYELSQTFRSEYTLISIVTAVLIFAVICLTFRKFSVPALLVCLIECAVFVTMSVMAISGTAMYFIALIIVQCILMGSMVDYGILLSSYYKEVRKNLTKEQALPEVMKRAYKAILTSALVMIAVTFILGAAMTGAVGDILLTLGVGTLSALILIMFVLPSLLAVCDKAVTWQWKGFNKKAAETETVTETEQDTEQVSGTPAEPEQPEE